MKQVREYREDPHSCQIKNERAWLDRANSLDMLAVMKELSLSAAPSSQVLSVPIEDLMNSVSTMASLRDEFPHALCAELIRACLMEFGYRCELEGYVRKTENGKAEFGGIIVVAALSETQIIHMCRLSKWSEVLPSQLDSMQHSSFPPSQMGYWERASPAFIQSVIASQVEYCGMSHVQSVKNEMMAAMEALILNRETIQSSLVEREKRL